MPPLYSFMKNLDLSETHNYYKLSISIWNFAVNRSVSNSNVLSSKTGSLTLESTKGSTQSQETMFEKLSCGYGTTDWWKNIWNDLISKFSDQIQ